MAFNRVKIDRTRPKLGRIDHGVYHPPTYYKGKPLPKPSIRPPIRGRPIDLTEELRRSTILSIPRDAIPEFIDSLVKQYERPAVQSAVLQQYDIYKLSPSPARDWFEAAMRYLRVKA